MEKCEQEGNYRAKILAYELREAQSGAVGVHLTCALTHFANPKGEWEEIGEPSEAEADIWIIKRDKELNDRGIESLIRWAGWTGNIEDIGNQFWIPNPIAVTVKMEEYQGQKRYKIAFINSYDSQPAIGAARAAELQRLYGDKIRSLGWSDQPPPVAPVSPAAPPERQKFVPQTNSDKDIPF
jgi:hypothetical protein